jgi:hypothetical protein
VVVVVVVVVVVKVCVDDIILYSMRTWCVEAVTSVEPA